MIFSVNRLLTVGVKLQLKLFSTVYKKIFDKNCIYGISTLVEEMSLEVNNDEMHIYEELTDGFKI